MVLFEFSFWGIHIATTWYGLMYAIGFLVCYLIIKKQGNIRKQDMDDLLLFIFIGVILGGRIGYVILYDLSYFLSDPLAIIEIWRGGMSFHGGALGVIIALLLFSRRYRYGLYDLSDPLVTILPLALGLGRIGNYLNKELLGYFPYEGPFAIIQSGISYFPSSLLQVFLEGVVLLAIMQGYYWYERKTYRTPGYMSALFLIGYGCIRIFAELFRLPDPHIGYLLGTNWMTLGMVYSLPMVLGGCILLLSIRKSYKGSIIKED